MLRSISIVGRWTNVVTKCYDKTAWYAVEQILRQNVTIKPHDRLKKKVCDKMLR